MALAYDGFIPIYDNETGRQVFHCPHCDGRLLGPGKHVRHPRYRIPLNCCGGKPSPFSTGLDVPPSFQAMPYLALRLHVWVRPSGERTYLWKIDNG